MLGTFLETKPSRIKLPLELNNKAATEDATEHTERKRQIRNSQPKLQWELKCQKITEFKIFVGNVRGCCVIKKAYLFSIAV